MVRLHRCSDRKNRNLTISFISFNCFMLLAFNGLYWLHKGCNSFFFEVEEFIFNSKQRFAARGFF